MIVPRNFLGHESRFTAGLWPQSRHGFYLDHRAAGTLLGLCGEQRGGSALNGITTIA